MKTTTGLILLFLSLATLHGQAEPATTAAALKEKLIASVKADMEKAGGNDARVSSSLSRFLLGLQQIQPDESHRDTEFQRLGMNLPDGSVSDQTRTLLESYSKQVNAEAEAAREKFLKEVDETGRAFIKRALASNEPTQIATIDAEVQDWANSLSNKAFRDSSKVNSQIYGLKNCVSSMTKFQAARADENWRNAASQLEQLRECFSKIRQFLPAEEAETYLENARRSIGLLSRKELQATFEKTLDELFNDANQDRLDEISDQIRKYHQLCGSSSSSSAMMAMSARWQQLSSLASIFIQNVQIVQNGGASRFSPEQWLRSNSESKPVMPRAEMINRLKNYKVRVIGENGHVEPMYDDIKDILGRIRNLGDLQKELPAYQKAARLSSYESESGNWSAIIPALNYYADLYAKLETGGAFVLRSINNPYSPDSMRYYPQAAKDLAAEKIIPLKNQAQWMVLQRFFPEIKTSGADPDPTIKALLEKSISAKNFDAVLNLSQTVACFSPDQQLLAPSEITAIQHYLAGIRQDDQLSEPRLATCYLQKAAVIRSSVIPVENLKTRLQKLKRDFPADYEKGTDDSFRPAPEEPSRLPLLLNVPAAAK
jgi:hypothetical protein